MKTQEDLKHILHRIDGRGYKAYKKIQGAYSFSNFTLFIDYVQGDPFASPSRLRVQVSQRVAQYPEAIFHNHSRRIGLESYLASAFAQACRTASERSGSGKSGLIDIDRPEQEILERTAINVTSKSIEARFVVGLPARGRTVLGRSAAALLCEALPRIVSASLYYKNSRPELIQRYVETNEDADNLRTQMVQRDLIAFVANDSLLPRRSGVDDRPMTEGNPVHFHSPESLQVEFELPNRGTVRGLGIPAGITLIVGGGFHGKSTLLNALERGIYNHKPGDGREFVVTDPTAVKIRAEDGRSVMGVNISPFMANLPYGQQTTAFSTENASGSTSQAANIIESLELGTKLLLIDEDTAATNFMIRDQRMQELIAKEKEPITPFIDKVDQLYTEHGVSSILVIGGSGDYFDVADTVIAMDGYIPHDVTQEAKTIAARYTTNRQREGGQYFGAVTERVPLQQSLNPRKGRRDTSIKTRGQNIVQIGEETIDLSAISQLVDESQTRALAAALLYAWQNYMGQGQASEGLSLSDIMDKIMVDIDIHGLDVLSDRLVGDFAAFRKLELGAALNRLRTLQML